MLCTRLLQTFGRSKLTLGGVRDVFSSVVSYSLSFANSSALREMAKRHSVVPEMKLIKHGFLDRHYYMTSKFWRGVWWFARTGSAPDAASKYAVAEDDLYFAKDFLPARSFRSLAKGSPRYYEQPVPESKKVELLNRLMPYINRLAYRRLEFISNNDGAIDTNDLIADLVADAIRALHTYDYIHDETKLINYVRRSVHNMAIKIIGERTTISRQRVKRVAKEDRDINQLAQYQSTTLSIDKPMGTDEEGGTFSLSHLLADPTSIAVVGKVEIEDFYANLVLNLSQSEMRFVKIVLGNYDADFEKWMYDNVGYESHEASFPCLVRSAYKFTGVSQGILQRKMENNDFLVRSE